MLDQLNSAIYCPHIPLHRQDREHIGLCPFNEIVMGTGSYFTPLLLQIQEGEERLGLENRQGPMGQKN